MGIKVITNAEGNVKVSKTTTAPSSKIRKQTNKNCISTRGNNRGKYHTERSKRSKNSDFHLIHLPGSYRHEVDPEY